MAKKIESLPSNSDVEKFEMLDKLVDSIYLEMKEFSKKKPDEPLNKFKVKSVNRVLEQVKDILSNEPTLQFLDLLDDETLPSNSDSILILGQFMAAMKQFHSKYWKREAGVGLRWSTKENPVK